MNSAKEATVCLLTHLTSRHHQGEGETFCGKHFVAVFFLLLFFFNNLAIICTRQNQPPEYVGMPGCGVIITARK